MQPAPHVLRQQARKKLFVSGSWMVRFSDVMENSRSGVLQGPPPKKQCVNFEEKIHPRSAHLWDRSVVVVGPLKH